MEPVTESSSEADAAHDMAIKSAEGAGVAQNWDVALDHLQHSAELGSRLAQAELAGLSGQWTQAQQILAGEAAPVRPWAEVRNSIDLAKWLEAPHRAMVSESPWIAGVKKFATEEMCDWLIARARARLRPARIYDDQAGEHRSSSVRTNSLAPFRASDRDMIIAILRARIAELTNMSVQAMQNPHILHYSLEEEFRPHYDTPADPNSPGFRRRVLTFLIALNDDYEGGETAFLAVKGRWKGRKGGALFFSNVGPDGMLDRNTLHAGRPVTRGEKWLLSQWIEG
jgi:prolyl 4-hydroxylase